MVAAFNSLHVSESHHIVAIHSGSLSCRCVASSEADLEILTCGMQAPGETAVAFTVPPTQAAYIISPTTGLVESVASSSVDVAEPSVTTIMVPNVSNTPILSPCLLSG